MKTCYCGYFILTLLLACVRPYSAFPGMEGDQCKCLVKHGLSCSNASSLVVKETDLSGTAADKLAATWGLMSANQQHGDYMGAAQTISKGRNTAYLESMSNYPNDERPASHQKMTHGIGGHAKMHFEWKNNSYTGMFQKADNCIVRIANAAQPAVGGPNPTAYNPNMAIKCFRDNAAESANILTIWEIDGFDVIPANNTLSCSFFDTPMSNHCGHRDNITMLLADLFIPPFDKVDRRGMMLGLSPMAEMNQEGQRVSQPNFPFLLLFQPHPDLHKVPCDFNNYTSQLRNLHDDWRGKDFYKIYAVHNPWYSRPIGRPEIEHLGSMVLDSPFIESMYGDHQLFFRHRFMKDELALLEKVDAQRAADWSAYSDPDTPDGRAHLKEEGAAWYGPFLPGGFDASKVQTCRSEVPVGRCLLKGCFGYNGNAQCKFTKCVCKPGYCTKDAKGCVPDSSTSVVFASVESSVHLGWMSLCLVIASASIGSVTMLLKRVRAHRSSSLHAALIA